MYKIGTERITNTMLVKLTNKKGTMMSRHETEVVKSQQDLSE